MTKMEEAFSCFDLYNQQDPTLMEWNGQQYPSEYFYAIQLYDWIKKLDTNASEPLLLASRCQHIGRWEISRKSYPDDRSGYLKWRSDLAKFHAQKATEILLSLNYDSETINRVNEIVMKKKIKMDTEVQVMEDALCLVFLQFQFDDLIKKQPAEKMIGILRKTWSKMSVTGRQVAMAHTYSDTGQMLLEKALAGADNQK